MLTEEAVVAQENPTLKFQRQDMVWLTIATVVVSIVTFIFGLWGSGWHLAPPLDDTFIHLQYAQQLAAGHPFQYNTGDAPSSGDSSFIYPFMLAPAFIFGLDGMKALLFADTLNLLAHLVAVLLLYKLSLRLFGRYVALLAALFLLLDGRVNWSFGTGMETGVYIAALIAFFYVWVKSIPGKRLALLSLTGVFVSLLRPEGHMVVSVVCLATLVYLWRGQKFRWSYIWLLLPVLAGLLPYAVNIALTGYWQFNTAASKSLLYVPYMPWHQKLSLMAGYFITMMKDVYLGLDVGGEPFPLFLTLPVMAIGIGWAFRKDRGRSFLNIMLPVTLVLGIGIELQLPPTHFYRYYQPYDFVVWLYLACGLVWIAERLASLVQASRTDSDYDGYSIQSGYNTKRRVLSGAGGLVVLFMLPQFLSYFFVSSDSTRDIYYQQMTFSDWVRRYTPKDARIGVNDVGAHKYLSDRYIVDVVGLTTNRLRSVHFSGWGSIFDILAAMPESERPQYLLVHPDLAINNIAESVSQSLLTPQYSITIQNPAVTAGPTEVLYKINWEYALLDPTRTYLLHKGETPLDQVNVGDLQDEQQHAYKIEGRQPSISEPKAIVSTATYESKGLALSDSGRRHSGWEEFTVKSVPGKALHVVSRSRLNPNASQQLLVYANGQQVGLWKVQNDRGAAWQEYEYEIPASFITGDKTTIRLDATFDPGGPGFPSYRYWFYGP